MKHLVVTGYASLDYIVNLSGQIKVDETTIIEIANTGVDFVSVGAITKHIKAIDLSMQIKI